MFFAFQLIGRTPLVFLNKITQGCGAYVAVKQEMMQPTASIKDRPALAMINDAEKKGLITPENRRVTMKAFGADLILTDPTKGMGGTAKNVHELLESTPNAFMLQQFSNQANTQTTGPEIWEDTSGHVDIFVMGMGSGGTVYGVGQYLKSQNPNVKIYGLEPAESTILSGGKPGPRHITGNGVGFKPDILDMDVMEEVLMVGISSGANTVAALRLSRRLENKGMLIVTVHPSFGERYLPSVLFQELRKEAENMQPANVD
ncbi:hypothetical protein CDL15_Pgr003606 [Punica granatum]|uniref:Tryptophan synthase beta chain-like PALP domain-containing protein n=1 Tax=Punica granatum TaxID=22663 RepID=A0A218XTD0_PUNGR|nr:hypothetical protein CDL15_Pgr003606 [Punica granatum]